MKVFGKTKIVYFMNVGFTVSLVNPPTKFTDTANA